MSVLSSPPKILWFCQISSWWSEVKTDRLSFQISSLSGSLRQNQWLFLSFECRLGLGDRQADRTSMGMWQLTVLSPNHHRIRHPGHLAKGTFLWSSCCTHGYYPRIWWSLCALPYVKPGADTCMKMSWCTSGHAIMLNVCRMTEVQGGPVVFRSQSGCAESRVPDSYTLRGLEPRATLSPTS